MPTPAPQLDPPTEADLTAAHSGVFRAVIGVNLGTPPPDHPLLDVYGQPLPVERLFIFPMECSNQGLDTYFTHMDRCSIENFVADSTAGTALMLGHLGPMGELPVGYSYTGAVVEEESGPQQRLVADTAIRFGPRFARAVETFYIVRGGNLASKPNDVVIAGIEDRSVRHGSVTFLADRMVCDLCGLDMFGGQCPHIPGVRYPREGALVRATVENRNAHKVETSLVYAHATPETGVVPVKARMVAAAGPLSRQEATDLQTLEARWGRRMIDPAHYRRVALISAPAKESLMPTPAKPTGTRADAPPPAAGTPASDSGTPNHQDLLSTVADDASGTAQGLADSIAALETQIQAKNDQVTALQNQLDSQGSAIDNTDLITAIQAEIDGMKADQAAMQTQLDAANATADATGGTPADAPSSSATPPADAGTAPAPAAMMNKARTAIGTMRTQAATYLTPLRAVIAQTRSVDPAALQPIVDGLSQLIMDLQVIMADTGTPPPQPLSVRQVFALMTSAGVPRGPGQYAALSRALLVDAPAGKAYRATLIDDVVRGKRRVVGDSAIDEPATRQMLANLDIAALEKEAKGYREAAKRVFTGGRAFGGEERDTDADTAADTAGAPADDDSPYLIPPRTAATRSTERR